MFRSSLWLLILVCASTHAAEREWTNERAHDRWIAAAAFSPQGDWLATCSDDQTLAVWEAATGKLRWRAKSEASLTALTWSSNGEQIFTGTWRGEVQVWDVVQGKLVSRWSAHRENISALSASADGTLLATASGDDRCRVWNLTTRRCVLTVDQENEYDFTSVAFSPDAKFIAVGDGENAVKLYRVSSGELLLTLAGHEEAVSAVVYAPDGKQIISGSADDTIRIWNADTGAEQRKLSGHRDDVTSLSLCGQGQRLLSGSADRSAILWDLAGGKVIDRFPGQSSITSAAVAPMGRHVAIGGQRVLHMWGASR